MSKHLIKILTICALIVLVPLVIVGVALTSTEAVGCTLSVFADGIEKVGETDYQGKSSDVKIFVNGEEKGTSVKLTKHTEVTVTYEGEGYNFEGWYNCNYSEIKGDENKVSTSVSYTFELNSDTILTAVRNVKVYSIHYTGKYDDDTTEIDETQTNVAYNQPLTTIESKAGATFLGWCEVDEQGNIMSEPTTVAKFTSANVTLVPAWSSQMKVVYLKGDTEITSRRLTESAVSSYTLLGANDQIVKNNITKGYEFAGWTNRATGADVTSISFDLNGIELVLKENLITYTINVKFNALSDSTTQVSYDVVNGFRQYSAVREGYTLTGADFNGTTYAYNQTTKTFNGLGDAIVANGEKEVTITALWECDYSSLYMSFVAVSEYTKAGDNVEGEWAVFGTYNGQDNQYIENENQRVIFEDKEGANYFDLQDNVYDYLMNDYTNLHIEEGNAVSFAGKVLISVDGTMVNLEYNLAGTNVSFMNILELVEANMGSLDNVTNLTVRFVFA